MAYSSNGRGYKKPPAGSQIKWGHPLTQGLVAAYPFLEGSGTGVYDLVAQNAISVENTCSWDGNRDMVLPVGTAGSYTQGPDIANKPYSIILGCSGLGTSTTVGATFSMGISGSNRQIIIIRPQNATTIRFSMWFDDLDATVATIVGRQLHLAFTLDDVFSQKTYDDAVLINSRTASGLYTGTRAVYIGGNAVNSEQIGATFRYIYVYDRAISKEEILWLKDAPYDLLTFPQARKWRLPAINGILVTVGSDLNNWGDGKVWQLGPDGPIGVEVNSLAANNFDYASLGYGNLVSDTLELSDAVTHAFSLPVEAYDSMFYGLGDEATLVPFGPNAQTASDTLSLSDAAALSLYASINPGDSFSLSDGTVLRFNYFPTFSDTLTLSDAAVLFLASYLAVSDDLNNLSDALSTNSSTGTSNASTDDMNNLSDAASTLLNTSLTNYLRRYLNDVVN